MNGKLSSRDYEALSTYLDGVLDERAKSQLENRLQVEEYLLQEFEALKQTRRVLRSQPRLRAPRNFTLTSEMAGVRKQSFSSMGAYPTLRLASILATIFLVLVMAGDFVGSSMRPQTIAVSDLPQQAPMLVPGFGMGGGGGGGDGAPALTEEQAIDSVASEPAELEEPAAVMKMAPEKNASEGEETLQTAPAVAPSAAIQEEPLPQGEAKLLEEEAESVDRNHLEETEIETPGQTSWPLIRVLQILLAILAVGSGVGAFFLRKTFRE